MRQDAARLAATIAIFIAGFSASFALAACIIILRASHTALATLSV